MKIHYTYLSLFFLVVINTHLVFGQSKIDLTITINTDCNCPKSSIVESGSQFGIYAHVPVHQYSDKSMDTLVQELKVKEKQALSLPQGAYKLIYTPSSSSKQQNLYYFHLTPYETTVQLNCLFFNKNYSFWRKSTHKQDSFLLTSSYFGPTNDGTAITTYSLAVIRKREQYFVKFWKSAHYTRDLIRRPQNSSQQYPQLDSMTLLSPAQVHQFKKLENTLFQFSNNNNTDGTINSSNNLWINNKQIHFKSRNYVALVWWNKLKEVLLNKK